MKFALGIHILVDKGVGNINLIIRIFVEIFIREIQNFSSG